MILFLLLSNLAFAQAAPNDAFVKPSPALGTTKYASDCGGEVPDLRAEMPPVDTQGLAGWCSTFTVRALLEHLYQRGRTEKNDRFSVMDINALNAVRPPEQYGRIPELNPDEGANDFMLLEGIQRKGRLYRDEDYRYDQRFFDRTGRIERLSAYYDRQGRYGGDPEALACRDQSPELVGVEQQFTGIENLLTYLDKGEFLSAVGNKFMILPGPKAGAKRERLSPPFNIRRVVPATGDQYVEELRQNLLAHRPTAIGVCANQMRQLPGLGWGAPLAPDDLKTCGGHALVVVGMKNIDGQCQVEVRNSWGAWWPKPSAGGYGWIPLRDFLQVQVVGSDVVSISPRPEGAPVANHIDLGGGYYYEGPTERLSFEGQGKLLGGAGLDEGRFAKGFMVEGRRTGPNAVYEGRFVNGLFYSGHMKGKLTSGAVYDGEYTNGALTGRGRVVAPDGTTFEGFLDNGRYMDGYFQGLLDPQRGLYYTGTLKGGGTQPDGKFTDQSGNPWKWQ